LTNECETAQLVENNFIMKTYSVDSRQRATLYTKAQLSEMREIQCIISRTIINQVYNCPINKYFAFAIRNTSRNPEKNYKNKANSNRSD